MLYVAFLETIAQQVEESYCGLDGSNFVIDAIFALETWIHFIEFPIAVKNKANSLPTRQMTAMILYWIDTN